MEEQVDSGFLLFSPVGITHVEIRNNAVRVIPGLKMCCSQVLGGGWPTTEPTWITRKSKHDTAPALGVEHVESSQASLNTG